MACALFLIERFPLPREKLFSFPATKMLKKYRRCRQAIIVPSCNAVLVSATGVARKKHRRKRLLCRVPLKFHVRGIVNSLDRFQKELKMSLYWGQNSRRNNSRRKLKEKATCGPLRVGWKR